MSEAECDRRQFPAADPYLRVLTTPGAWQVNPRGQGCLAIRFVPGHGEAWTTKSEPPKHKTRTATHAISGS